MGRWEGLAARTSGQLGYPTICAPPWTQKIVMCKTFTSSLAPLFICRWNYNCNWIQILCKNYGESGLGWSPMTPCSGQEWTGMPWNPFSAFSRLFLVFFNMIFKKEPVVPVAAEKQKCARLLSATIPLICTRQIGRKLSFYCEVRRAPQLMA